MKKLPKSYETKIIFQTELESPFGSEGWVPEYASDGEFNNFQHFSGIIHDLFEHWFERSVFFPCENFTIAAEVVASGVREYLLHNSYIIQDCNKYNGTRYNEPPLNNADFLFLAEEYFYNKNSSDPEEILYELFPEDPDFFKKLPVLWNMHDYWPMIDDKSKYPELDALKPEFDKYFMYGHALGYHMFDDCLRRVERVYDNFKQIYFSREEFLNPFESIKYVHNQRWPKIVINDKLEINEFTTFEKYFDSDAKLLDYSV